MPGPRLDGIHLHHPLLDPVLTEDRQAGVQCRPADLGTEAFGNGDDRDLARVTPRARDSLPDRSEILGDAHRNATMAPKRVPSGLRRCDGRKSVSLVHSPMTSTSLTPSASSCARFAAARSSRKRSPAPRRTKRASNWLATSSPTS